jgi:hypothetical protein
MISVPRERGGLAMDKLLTVDHVFKIIEVCGCKRCNKQTDRVCPKDCEILKIKYALDNAKADAVLAAIAVDARLV